jgi:hypothetical protein
MANVINLGSYPTDGGVNREDKSLYIGNNRFVRILSQSDPNRVIAVMSESTDVFSETQTLTNIHEQVILTDTYITNFKIGQLPSGNIFIFGRDVASSGYTNKILVIGYDDVNTQFNIVSEHDITSSFDSYLYNMYSFKFETYGSDSLIVMGISNNSTVTFARIDNLEGANNSITKTVYLESSVYGTYFRGESSSIDIIDDKAYFKISSTKYYQSTCIDLTSGNILYGGRYYIQSFVKLDTDRFVAIKYDSTRRVMYTISPTYVGSSDQSSAAYFAPIIDHGSTEDDNIMSDSIPMDRQHLIYFYKPENATVVYARFLKVLDEFYGFVSDNSVSGAGITVCNITSNTSAFDSYNRGKLVNQISDTEFWIQTDNNEFTFLTMSTS